MKNILLKIILTFLALFFMGPFYAFAQDSEIKLAESFYQSKNYSLALKTYFQDASITGPNAALFYNIGNSFYKNQDIGKAICYYQKAKKLAPRDRDIKANLKKAQAKVLDNSISTETSFTKGLFSFIYLFSFNEVLVLFLIIFSLCNTGIFLAIYYKKQELLKHSIIPVAIILGLSFILLYAKVQTEFYSKTGVIISKKVAVKAGPSNTLETLFYVHEGVEFTIEKVVGDWLEIKLNNSFIGWAHKKDLFEI
ncbi:hypothetical protein ACFL2K_01700 [Candidatus Margulisiibacteriota bacterium]